jgi:hypothetical protein
MGDFSKELAELIDVWGVSEEDRLQVLGPKELAGEVPMEVVKHGLRRKIFEVEEESK